MTVRAGPRVQRSRFARLDAALLELERQAHELTGASRRAPVDARYRRFEPAQQVAARLELAGPQRVLPAVRAGLDVRGDGSTEAYVGRLRRRAIEPRRDETPLAALRRELAASGRR